MSVYASWNGATGVARWQALTGPHSDQLSPAGGADRAGFETTITGLAPRPAAAVAALDRGGRVLGRSPAVSTITT